MMDQKIKITKNMPYRIQFDLRLISIGIGHWNYPLIASSRVNHNKIFIFYILFLLFMLWFLYGEVGTVG